MRYLDEFNAKGGGSNESGMKDYGEGGAGTLGWNALKLIRQNSGW